MAEIMSIFNRLALYSSLCHDERPDPTESFIPIKDLTSRIIDSKGNIFIHLHLKKLFWTGMCRDNVIINN